MNNLLSAEFLFGNENFGLNVAQSRPAFYIFGFEIYLYALFITMGMCLAILITAIYFKKRGYDPYDATIYALVIIPCGVLGARAYTYIFPWAGQADKSWIGFFSDFRDGGLGIYGGVATGFLSAMICAKIRKQDFRIVSESVLPGVLLAQSLGRWGNFANQEAFGNLISTDFNALPHAASGLFSKFNGYAVWIDAQHGLQGQAGWYQATFFYEAACTFLGFLICVLVLARSKKYKLGWVTAFYGIFYGTARLIIEGMRTDSLFLYVGHIQTDIKISQLAAVLSIILGIWTLTKIYRKQIHALYRKLFNSEYDEVSKSRFVLIPVVAVSLGVAITMFVLGGATKFIIGVVCSALAIYALLGIFSLQDRLKLYCSNCKERKQVSSWQSDYSKSRTAALVLGAVSGVLIVFGLFSLIKWGIVDGITNGTVLAVVCFVCAIALIIFKLIPACKIMATSPREVYQIQKNCSCGTTQTVQLNSFLLFVFPPKVYIDYGVEHLTPWVDPQKAKKQQETTN